MKPGKRYRILVRCTSIWATTTKCSFIQRKRWLFTEKQDIDSPNLDYVRMNYNLLAYDYIGLKNTVKATEALGKYVELTDRVYRENQKKTIAEMEVKYITELLGLIVRVIPILKLRQSSFLVLKP